MTGSVRGRHRPTEECVRARSALWPRLGPREWTEAVDEGQRHVERCGACRAFFREDEALASLLREAARRLRAPVEVRERVFAAVARERAGGRPGGRERRSGRPSGMMDSKLGVWSVLLAFVALSGATAWWISGRVGQGGDPGVAGFVAASLLAEDHARDLRRASVRSSDPAEVKDWLEARIPFAVEVRDFPKALLTGGRLCLVDGRQGAVVEYEVEGRPVSYYVMPSPGGLSAEREAERFLEEASAGYNVVAWRDGGLTHALVGDVSRVRLRSMADDCAGRPLGRVGEGGGPGPPAVAGSTGECVR